MNSVRSNNLSLKYQRFTPSGGKNIGTRKSEFVTKTQFLWPAIPTNKQNIEEFCRHTLNFHWYNKCKMSSIFFH